MARIISFVNQKGGVGKSTSVINTGAFLAAHGKYVLIVDLDPQSNTTSGLGVNSNEQEWNLYHTLSDGIMPEEAIVKTGIFGLDILPSHPDLAGAGRELVTQANREYKLHDVLNRIRSNYDYILIDSPPSLGLLTVNGLVAADHVIIPVQCEYYSLEGLGHLLNTIDLIKNNLGKNLNVMGAVLTMYDRRNKLSHGVLKEMQRNFPGRVFDAVIPRSISLAEAPSYGKSILHYAPASKGARAYHHLAREILALEDHDDTLNQEEHNTLTS